MKGNNEGSQRLCQLGFLFWHLRTFLIMSLMDIFVRGGDPRELNGLLNEIKGILIFKEIVP